MFSMRRSMRWSGPIASSAKTVHGPDWKQHGTTMFWVLDKSSKLLPFFNVTQRQSANGNRWSTVSCWNMPFNSTPPCQHSIMKIRYGLADPAAPTCFGCMVWKLHCFASGVLTEGRLSWMRSRSIPLWKATLGRRCCPSQSLKTRDRVWRCRWVETTKAYHQTKNAMLPASD